MNKKHQGKYSEASGDGQWKIFSNTYPELHLSLKEFIDNSISAIYSKRAILQDYGGEINIVFRELRLDELSYEGFEKVKFRDKTEYKLEQTSENEYAFEQLSLRIDAADTFFLIEIFDDGIGMDNFDDFFKIGKDIESPVGTFLNEHGIGGKNALAQANYENDAWEICSRTINDFNEKTFKRVKAPYQKSNGNYDWETIDGSKWDFGNTKSTTGTAIRVVVDRDNLNTLQKGKGKSKAFSVEGILKNFVEEIEVNYSGFLEDRIQISVEYYSIDGATIKQNLNVNKVCFQEIIYKNKLPLVALDKSENVGYIKIREGFIQDNSKNSYYFKKTIEAPKVLVYFNNRLIGPIWNDLFEQKIKHNTYNNYYAEIHLKLDDANYYPSLNATKTQFVKRDKLFQQILKLIKAEIVSPKIFSTILNERERMQQFVKKIKEREVEGKYTHLKIDTENKINDVARVDAYLSYTMSGVKTHELYEFKQGKVNIQHLFQLRGYLEVLEMEMIPVESAILVVDKKPDDLFTWQDIEKYRDYVSSKSKIELKIMTYEELNIPTLKDFKGNIIDECVDRDILENH